MHMMVGFDMEAANDANNGNQSHERLMQISGCHYIQFIDCLQIDFWSCCFHFVLPKELHLMSMMHGSRYISLFKIYSVALCLELIACLFSTNDSHLIPPFRQCFVLVSISDLFFY